MQIAKPKLPHWVLQPFGALAPIFVFLLFWVRSLYGTGGHSRQQRDTVCVLYRERGENGRERQRQVCSVGESREGRRLLMSNCQSSWCKCAAVLLGHSRRPGNTCVSFPHLLTRFNTWSNTNGGDTQSRNLYKKLVQVDLYKKLDPLTWFVVQVFSWTSFLHRIQHSSIPHKKLACTWLEWWVTHCVRWGSGRSDLVVKPRSQNMQLQIAAVIWRTERMRFHRLWNYVGACYTCIYRGDRLDRLCRCEADSTRQTAASGTLFLGIVSVNRSGFNLWLRTMETFRGNFVLVCGPWTVFLCIVLVCCCCLMVVTHSQETCTRNLYKSTCTRNLTVWHGFLYNIFLVHVSCTEYSTALFHTRNLHARD